MLCLLAICVAGPVQAQQTVPAPNGLWGRVNLVVDFRTVGVVITDTSDEHSAHINRQVKAVVRGVVPNAKSGTPSTKFAIESYFLGRNVKLSNCARPLRPQSATVGACDIQVMLQPYSDVSVSAADMLVARGYAKR